MTVERARLADLNSRARSRLPSGLRGDYGRQHHLGGIPLLGLRAVYLHGFPSSVIWTRRETDWGLTDLYAIQYSYLDAMTMVQQIVAHHGGVPALRRLAADFEARAGKRDFTEAEVTRRSSRRWASRSNRWWQRRMRRWEPDRKG